MISRKLINAGLALGSFVQLNEMLEPNSVI